VTTGERSKDLLFIGGFFLLALALRLLYLGQIAGHPYFDTLVLDAQAYDRQARQILNGNWLGGKVFYQDPFYPYFLAVIYKIFGPEPGAARLVQLILGTLGTALIYPIGRRLAGRKAGISAALLALSYGLFYFYDGLIGKDGPGLVLVILALWTLLRAADRATSGSWLAAGAALGLAALTRGNLLLLVPLFALWTILAPNSPLKNRLIQAGLFILAFILVISPVTIHNWLVGRDFVPLTAQAGQNFYIGNNPRASGFFEHPERIRLVPQYEEEDFRREAFRLTGRRDLKPSEISDFWMAQGWKYVREHPGRTLELLGLKTAMFFNDFEIPDNYNFYFAKEQTWQLKVLGLSFGLIAPLGLVGLALLWPDRRRFFLPAIFFLGYLVSIVPFHLASRYRLPVVPLLIAAAPVTLLWLYEKTRSGNRRALAKVLIPLAVLLVFCHWPFYAKGRTFDASYTALGIAAAESGHYQKAVDYYGRALEINPDYASAHYNLGNAYLALKKYDRAEAAFSRAVELDRHLVQAYLNWGNLYLETGRFDQAARVFQRGVSQNPGAAELYVGWGLSFHFRSLYSQAASAFQQALEIEPDLAPAHYNLACALARTGLVDQAWSHLAEAARLDPRLAPKALEDEDLRPLGPPDELRRRLGLKS